MCHLKIVTFTTVKTRIILHKSLTLTIMMKTLISSPDCSLVWVHCLPGCCQKTCNLLIITVTLKKLNGKSTINIFSHKFTHFSGTLAFLLSHKMLCLDEQKVSHLPHNLELKGRQIIQICLFLRCNTVNLRIK